MTTTTSLIEGLPPPRIVIPLDHGARVDELAADLVARLPEAAAVVPLESEPLRKLIETYAYDRMLIDQRVNEAARGQLIAFAAGPDLEHLAAFYDVARLNGETDAALRERIILEIAGRSPGGTAERYRAKALGASITVRDAHVWGDGISPVVNIAVFSTAPNGTASPALLALVASAVNAPEVRMVNDTLIVVSAVAEAVAVSADVWLLPETADGHLATMQQALRGAWALEGGLGFDLARAWIAARLMIPGVQRVEVTAPLLDRIAQPHEALALGTVALTLRGRTR